MTKNKVKKKTLGNIHLLTQITYRCNCTGTQITSTPTFMSLIFVTTAISLINTKATAESSTMCRFAKETPVCHSQPCSFVYV